MTYYDNDGYFFNKIQWRHVFSTLKRRQLLVLNIYYAVVFTGANCNSPLSSCNNSLLWSYSYTLLYATAKVSITFGSPLVWARIEKAKEITSITTWVNQYKYSYINYKHNYIPTVYKMYWALMTCGTNAFGIVISDL